MEVQSFFEHYRTTFAGFDRDALLECFAFPLQIVSAGDEGVTVSVSDRAGWTAVLDWLLDAYRSLGVADAEALTFDVAKVMPAVSSVRVHWELRRDDGSIVYDFTAVYTVVEADGAVRVAAVTHDELPRLQAAMAAG